MLISEDMDSKVGMLSDLKQKKGREYRKRRTESGSVASSSLNFIRSDADSAHDDLNLVVAGIDSNLTTSVGSIRSEKQNRE